MDPDHWTPIDLDTPHHEEHIRDNVLNAGCRLCGPFLDKIDVTGIAAWEAYRKRRLAEVENNA